MSDIERNGLHISSTVEAGRQTVTVSKKSGKLTVPAFTVDLNPTVEHMNAGRHSLAITVHRVADLIRAQRDVNKAWTYPFELKNNLVFVFDREASEFGLYREIAGDGARNRGKIKLGQAINLYNPWSWNEHIIAGVSPVIPTRRYAEEALLFTMILGTEVKTITLPRNLRPFVGVTPGDGTSTEPESDLADYVDFTYSK